MGTQPLMRKAGLLEDETGLHLLTLSVLLLETLGPQCLTWDYAALRAELEERWGQVGNVTWQRIMALTVLHLHNIAWVEWEVFENMVAAIMGEIPLFSFVQPPEAEEIAIALETFKRVDASHAFSEEVKDYIVASLLNDGFWYLDGTPLSIAQSSLTTYDLREDIQRDVGAVAKALQSREGFFPDPESGAEVQANRVREVELVLKRYSDEVNSQLQRLPDLLRRHT